MNKYSVLKLSNGEDIICRIVDSSKEKVKIDAAQKAADIALQEEKLDLEKDKVEVEAAEKLAKIKGVARDREIVAESKTADRDDKFLIEMIKLLM